LIDGFGSIPLHKLKKPEVHTLPHAVWGVRKAFRRIILGVKRISGGGGRKLLLINILQGGIVK